MANEKRLIDANALVPYLWALYKFFGSSPCTEADKATQRGIKRCIGEIKKMPTVDAVEVVRGHKVVRSRCRGIAYAMECPICLSKFPSNKPFTENVEYCSVCGKKLDDTFQNYCPNCGAKMDGDGNA